MAQRDYDINDCYNHFISKAADDKLAYENELSKNKEVADFLYKEIMIHYDEIKTKFDIDLKRYTEFADKRHSEDKDLYNKIVRLIKTFGNDEDTKLLNPIAKYLAALKNIDLCKKGIAVCSTRKNVQFATYKALVKKYYTTVNNKALEGKGIRFSNGLGIFTINYEKIDHWTRNKTVDFQASARAKKELLAKGLKPYDKQEAEEYAKAGIAYDGIEYLVFKEEQYKLSVDMIAPAAFRGGMLKIIPVNTLPKDLRNKTYRELAEQYTEQELNNRNYYIIGRADINIKRNPLNYLRYTHKVPI